MKKQCMKCRYYTLEEDKCWKHNPEAYIEKYTCDDFEPEQARAEIDALRRQLERVSGLASQLRQAVNDGILSEADGMPAIASLCRTQAELGIQIEHLSNGSKQDE